MPHEPDWKTLSEINFLLANRMTEQLTAALTALDKIDTPSPQRSRATAMTSAALNTYTAWASLIRHNAGEAKVLPGGSQFESHTLLNWLATVLNIRHFSNSLEDEESRILLGNRETLQEALVLLRSCAQTLGPGVRVTVEEHARGLWFKVRYGAVGSPATTLSDLLTSLQSNWRSQSTAFELRCAQDFLTMNNTDLCYNVRHDECELAFFIKAAQANTRRRHEPTSQDRARALLDSYNADETHRVITK